MRDTILFDLDGTLLPLDMDNFLKIYFYEMGKAFQDLIEPKKLISFIWAGTEAMIKNIEPRTNEEVFMETFSQLIDGDLDIYKQRFDFFYDKGFLNTRKAVESRPVVHKIIRMLKDKGYTLAIATNPIFPMKAIQHRINWAGLDANDFDYVSSYEENCYCKPQLEYYKEVVKALGKRADQCTMIGNDAQDDLIAGHLGIDTYLIEDYLIHRSKEEVDCTYQGTYDDLYAWTHKLKPLL